MKRLLIQFNERFPACVLVWPVRVQGEGSADEVAAAIRGFNALEAGGKIPRPDVLIVARGGGSLEDLWSFNEENVVRAAAESRIPLISAVGHETDWTLIDLAAGARAPTPTKAAEWAVPMFSELTEQLDKYGLRQRVAVRRVLESQRTHLKAAARGLPNLQDLLALPRQKFDSVEKRLGRALLANTRAHALRLTRLGGRLTTGVLVQRLGRGRERLAALDARAIQALANRVAVRRRLLDTQSQLLRSLSYQSVLQRGFALVRNGEGAMVRLAHSVIAGETLSIEFSDGIVAAEAKGGATPAPPPEPGRPSRPRRRSAGGGQGSLF